MMVLLMKGTWAKVEKRASGAEPVYRMPRTWCSKGFNWDVSTEGPVQIRRSIKLCLKKRFIVSMEAR